MNGKLLLIGVLTVILLVLYCYTIKLEINVAMDCAKGKETTSECVAAMEAHTNFVIIFSSVGGMIAAFAVSVLAVSEPGSPPTAGLNTFDLNGLPEKIAKMIPFAIVATWLIGGVLAIYFGFKYDGSPPLTEMGKTWIGTALAGVGAYIGYKPN